MTNGRYTVFGLRKGDPAWMEALICDTGSRERYEQSVRNAVLSGYVITREYKPDTELSAPDFVATVNV